MSTHVRSSLYLMKQPQHELLCAIQCVALKNEIKIVLLFVQTGSKRLKHTVSFEWFNMFDCFVSVKYMHSCMMPMC